MEVGAHGRKLVSVMMHLSSSGQSRIAWQILTTLSSFLNVSPCWGSLGLDVHDVNSDGTRRGRVSRCGYVSLRGGCCSVLG